MSQPDATETEASTTRLGQLLGVDRPVKTAQVLRVIGLVWLTLVGWWLAGVVGVAVGLLLAIGAVIVRPVVLVALAHAGLVILVPDLSSLTSIIEIGLFELGVIAILVSEPPVDQPTTVLTIGIGLALAGVIIAADIWISQLATILFLLVLVAVVGYGIHRYEQVALGLVDPEPIEKEQHNESKRKTRYE